MKRILIVEDSAPCRAILEIRLRFPPCRAYVESVETLSNAKAAIVGGMWDLVVLDLWLGLDNTTELIPLIRGRLVLCTGSPDEAPPGLQVIAKGPHWATAIERIVLGLP